MVTQSPGFPLTRKVTFNQNIALALTSIVSQHGFLVYSSLLNAILDEVINDVDHFLMALDAAFYIEDMHLLLDEGSKCVHEGRDCVVIWKMIVGFFLKLTTSALEHGPRRVNQLFNTPL